MIDAHQHYWHPARGDYGWMAPDDPVLARPFAPTDLAPLLGEAGVARTVLVQAAPTVAETHYMLGIADAEPSVAAVVGWVDFEEPADRAALERLAGHPKLRGVRPMIQDIADDDWMGRKDVQWGFAALADLGLRLDALGFPRHLPRFERLMDRHPDLPVVIDHGMKPRVASSEGFEDWAAGMTRLAKRGAFCKLSGLVTEAVEDWEVEDLRPYAEHILDAFGPERVMWGSDWPVCLRRASYADWLRTARDLTVGLDEAERARLFGGTAAAFYGLG